MGLAAGIDDHQFHVGVRLQRHAGQGLRQAGAVHAAYEHAHQWKLGGIVGQVQTLPHPGPLRQSGQGALLLHGRQVHAEEGFGLLARRAQPKGAQGGHGTGVGLVVFDAQLRSEALKRAPLALGHGVDGEVGVGVQRRATLVEQHGVQAGPGLAGGGQAGQGSGLVVRVRLRQRGQQQHLRLVLSDGLRQGCDQGMVAAQGTVFELQEQGFGSAQHGGGSDGLLTSAGWEVCVEARLCGVRALLATCENHRVYPSPRFCPGRQQAPAAENFVIGVRCHAQDALHPLQ